MFKRNVLVIALLAVVLLVSFMDGRIEVNRDHRHRPRATAAVGLSAVDSTLHQAKIGNLMQQVAGGIAGIDPNNRQASLMDNLRRHRTRVNIDPRDLNQVAGGMAGIDPNL